MHLIITILGIDNEAGRWYAFWSGFGSDISELSLFGALVVMLRKHTCHAPRCFRMGRYKVEGTVYVLCHKHHPDGRPSLEDILRAADQ